jgi:flagellar L-ring protein precursor FlgH
MRLLKLAAAGAIAVALAGCAVVPFLPTIVQVVPRVLFPDHQPAQQAAAKAPPQPDPPDPALAKAITARPALEGDTGIAIGQQDRVTFMPAAPGSIPLRVNAVDLVDDLKARNIGDVVTIQVVESFSSESKAGTNLSNQRSLQAGLPNLFGAVESLAKHNPLLNLSSMANASSSNASTGTGDMTAADTFTATVSALVVAVNPSGTLTIRGERRLKINGEDDTIHISGVVRPQDIDSNDSVSSTQVADLQLSITGQGQIRDKQGDGLGTRAMDWLWVF